MKIVINGVDFDNASWVVSNGLGVLIFQTEMTIAEILTSIGENESISVFDGDTLVSTWQNNGVKAVEIFGESRMQLSFDVSILTRNAEAQIHAEIDESVDGIMELAGLLDAMDKSISENSESIETLEGKASEVDDSISEISEKLSNIPDDIISRFSELWSNYNALADRVARLENRGE